MILQELSHLEEDITKRAFVDLGISSDTYEFDPDEITRDLGINPSRSWRKGEKFYSKTKNPDTGEYYQSLHERYQGVWGWDTKSLEDKRVESHLIALLNNFEPVADKLVSYQLRTDWRVSIYIRWEPVDRRGGYEVRSDILIRIAKLSQYIEFNFIG